MVLRELTLVEVCKRVRLLDALYLSADHWARVARDATTTREQRIAHGKYEAARREYERVRDAPFAIADE